MSVKIFNNRNPNLKKGELQLKMRKKFKKKCPKLQLGK